jgi:hypothetical protein
MSSFKGYLWSFVFFLTAAVYSSIPTYVIVIYWPWLNSFTLDGRPVYTIPLFILFLWIISLIIFVIYAVAMIRAIVQRKNDDLGIPKGIKYYGLISSVIVIVFMIVWFILYNEIAFFSMTRPVI